MGVLGGSIGAVSNPSHGSIFWIAFPIEEAHSERQTASEALRSPHITRVTSARQQRNKVQENTRQSVEEYVSNAQPGPPPTQRSSAGSASGPRRAASLSRHRSSSQSMEGLPEDLVHSRKLSSRKLAELASQPLQEICYPQAKRQPSAEENFLPPSVPPSMEACSAESGLSSAMTQPHAAAAAAVEAASKSSLFLPASASSLRKVPAPPLPPPPPQRLQQCPGAGPFGVPSAGTQSVPVVTGHPYAWPVVPCQHSWIATGVPLLPPAEHSVAGSVIATQLALPWGPHAQAAPTAAVPMCYFPMPSVPRSSELTAAQTSPAYCQPQVCTWLPMQPSAQLTPSLPPASSTPTPAISERRGTDAYSTGSGQPSVVVSASEGTRDMSAPAEILSANPVLSTSSYACSRPGSVDVCAPYVSATSVGVSSSTARSRTGTSGHHNSSSASEAFSASVHHSSTFDAGASTATATPVEDVPPLSRWHSNPPEARFPTAPPSRPSGMTFTNSLASRSSAFGSEGGISARSQGSRRTVSALSLCDDALPGESDLGISGTKILLAEDNLINQLVAKKMLTALGVKVTVVANGRDAIDAVLARGANGFDIILMDMAMPVMDGVAAAAELRRLRYTLPIVAMTANLSERDQELCREAGMNGFLSKPILKGRLRHSLKQVLTRGTLFADIAPSE
jgi:CheY-like chemotaxis protein